MSRLAAIVCSLVLITPLLAADPVPKVPDGFKCEIVLQAPDIEAPTALCVAPNGDVYFAEDPMDMSGPPTKNIDKIWMLKGGDPKKKILIADKMWAVMGLEIVRDKLYVVHAPHVTIFTLDADGKPTKREELFDDLGPPVAGVPGFNDHIPSGIRMGMDGWLYVSIGDKGIPKMTRKEKDQGSVHVAEGRWRHTKEGHYISLEGGGVIRFRPDGSGLEVFASGTRNILDVPMDEHDRIFVRDNTDDGDGWNTRFMYLPRGAFMGYPWAFKQRPSETLPMIHDFGGGAPCGGYVYCDDGLPEKYRGRIFHCEWGQGKVWAVKVAPDGAGFKYVDQIAFMDPTGTGVKDFRPFSIRPLADGRGFYVTDWGLSGWLQKVKRGRIFKVTYTKDDVKPAPRGLLTEKSSIEDLVKGLDHPAHTERLRIQRILEEKTRTDDYRASSTLGKLNDIGLKYQDVKHPAQMRHLLWAMFNADLRRYEIKDSSMVGDFATPTNWRGHDPSVLAVCYKIYGEVTSRNLLYPGLSSSSPQVRLQTAIGLSNGNYSNDAFEYLNQPDVYVRYALGKALQAQSDNLDWQEIVKNLAATKNSDIREVLKLAFAGNYHLRAVSQLAQEFSSFSDPKLRVWAIESLAKVYRDRKPYPGTWWGTRPEQQKPPARVVEWEGTPLVREAILNALGDKEADVRKAAVLALVNMNDPATLDPLISQFDKEKSDDTRTDIVRAVAAVQSGKSRAFLTSILEKEHPPTMCLEAIAGLEKSSTASELLAKTATGENKANATEAVQVRAFEALGALKAKSARKACEIGVKDERAAVRRAAVTTLGKLGDADAAMVLLPLLADKDAQVKAAAIQALGTLKAKTAIPALMQASGDEATQFDAILALTQMPDKHALNAYLAGLASKNQDMRKASSQAIATVREEVLPDLEQLVKRNEVRAEVLPELRAIYLAYVPILDWKLIGPFPEDGKGHPPETELKFDAKYQGAGKQVAWRNQKGDARNHGRVNLAGRFSPTDDVAVYGYTEIEAATERDAELLIGSDDTMTIWLNGKKVFEFNGSRGWNYNADKVKIHLEKGKNTLLIKCGNKSGPWEFSVAVTGDVEKYAFLKGGVQKHNLETFRAFARKNAGDSVRGKKLFEDVKGLACIKCHSVGGVGGKVGPDLAGIAIKYKREDLMTSVLEPSKVIAQGYETIVITTKKGQTITGVFKGETGDAINAMDKEGKPLVVLKKDVDERAFSPLSMMPNGLNEGMTLQDFADVIAFLEARREEKK